jgi:sodium/proline symporter
MSDPVIVVIMLVTILVTIGIGVHSYWSARTQRQYFAYDGQLRWFVMGIATYATLMSGFGFIGGPGLVYAIGSTSLWMTFAAALGIPLSFLLLGRRLRALAGPDVITLPDAIHKCYGGSQAARFSVAICILLGIVAYLGSQILAAAVVLQDVFGSSFGFAFLTALTVIAIYPLIGGIVAGLRTEVFQGAIMLCASVMICYLALASGGGMAQITAHVASADQTLVTPWGAASALTGLGYLFVFAVGNPGMPHNVSRFLMLKDASQLRRSLLLALSAYMLGSLLWMLLGFAVRAHVAVGNIPALASADQAAPAFLMNFTPPWLAGIAFAGLLSAILSTASIFLNVGAACLTRDIPMSFNRPLAHPVFWARVWTGILALVSAAVAFYSMELVALLGAIGYGLHAAGIAPALILGLWWPRATPAGVVASGVMAVGGSVYFFVAQQLGYAAQHGWWVPAHGFPSVGLVMLLSFAIFVVVSLATPPRRRVRT